VVEHDIQVVLTGGEGTLHLFHSVDIYIIMEEEIQRLPLDKIDVLGIILNTKNFLNRLGTYSDPNKPSEVDTEWDLENNNKGDFNDAHGGRVGETVINRFEVTVGELSEEEKERYRNSGSKYKHTEYVINITMFLNTDKDYISCDDLWYEHNVDPSWWEASIIPDEALKYMGISPKEYRDFTIKLKAMNIDGTSEFCEEHM